MLAHSLITRQIPNSSFGSARLRGLFINSKKRSGDARTSRPMTDAQERNAPMAKDLPKPELLRKLLRYEPDTGKLFWLHRTPDMFDDGAHLASVRCAMWNSRYAGKEALSTINKGGYRHGTVLGQTIFSHRVVWAIHYGQWPKSDIDHVNGNRLDNCIDNLRVVSRRENMRNAKRPVTNTSGVVGVFWNRSRKKWGAHISDNNGSMLLGEFANKSDAIAARKDAEKRLGYHENHGRGANCS